MRSLFPRKSRPSETSNRIQGLRDWEAAALLFSIGWSVMVVQLLSSRLIAPFFGVSLYSWTSVIGATLIGMVVGAIAGGRLAEKESSRLFLGRALFIVACGVIMINQLAPAFGGLLNGLSLPLWAKTFFFSFFTFVPAAILLSSLTPQLIKLATPIEGTMGRRLGGWWAMSGLGNVVGVSLTNPWLVPWVGTAHLILVVSVLFIGWSFWLTRPDWPTSSRTLAIAIGCLLLGNALIGSFCQEETRYYCVRVTEKKTVEGLPSFVLRLDHLVHSTVTPQRPARLGYSYESVYANLVATRFSSEKPFSALFIGGGGYVFPRYLAAFYPHATSTVAEIDPGVTRINHAELGLAYDPRIETVNEDARRFLLQTPSSTQYDLVFGDAFNDFGVPVHLTTLEFHRLLKQHLRSDGVYALNLIDDPRYGQFLASMIRTLNQVWKYVEVAPQQTVLKEGDRNTIVLLASDEPIVRENWTHVESPARQDRFAQKQEAEWNRELSILSATSVRAFLGRIQAPVLTDALAPVDRYLAPVFRDAQ